MSRVALLLAVFVALTGCAGTPTGDTPGSTDSSTASASLNTDDEQLRTLAIAAERQRIRRVLGDNLDVTDVYFEERGSTGATILTRNETRAVVAVTVQYTVVFNHACAPSNTTTATYSIDTTGNHLRSVEQDVLYRSPC